MTPPPSVPDLPGAPDDRLAARSDDELVDLVRAGDAAAYGELFARHRGIGTAIARRYFDVADPDDIVAESFARILATIKRGGGPRAGFRPYLITTIGNVARRWATRSKESASDELDQVVDPASLDDPVVASTDRDFALEAFKSLPERWQAVLWYSAVEGMGPTEISGYLGMTPNATAVLAHRARAGLRTAWVQAHLNDATLPAECRTVAGRLGRRATGSLNRREQEEVKAHLATCLACRARARELDQVSARLASWLVPALLGLAFPFADDGSAAAAATTPAAPVPLGTGVPIGITAGVAIGTAASLVAALLLGAPTAVSDSTDPTAADRGYELVVDSAPNPSRDAPSTIEPAASPTAPGGSDAALPLPSASASESGSAPSAETISPLPPPSAPIITLGVDPFALTPPTLAGTAQPGARLVVVDELGTTLAEVPVGDDSAWSTGMLAALSPAAAALEVYQVDALDRRSPSVTVALSARPESAGVVTPLAPDWYLTNNQYTPLTLNLRGWPGATVWIDHANTSYPEEPRFPSAVVLDSTGHASLTVPNPWAGTHSVTVRYGDSTRQSSGTTQFFIWVPWYPD
jgi:RNA polymerase sigma factor (sigma-70 family)